MISEKGEVHPTNCPCTAIREREEKDRKKQEQRRREEEAKKREVEEKREVERQKRENILEQRKKRFYSQMRSENRFLGQTTDAGGVIRVDFSKAGSSDSKVF